MGDLDVSQYLGKWTEQKFSYNQRDLITYAVGIGCTELRFVYENHEDFCAFPTYGLLGAFKGTAQDVVTFPSPAMMEGPQLPPLPGVRFGLDGERYVEQINPLPEEGAENLTLKTRTIGVHKRGSGASVEQEALIVGEDGTEYTRLISGSFLVGAKGFKDAGRTNSEKITPPSRQPDKVVELTTSPYQAQIYRLSGDYNPLHVDPDIAQMNGFKEPILHGLCSLGFSTRALLNAYCGNDPVNFKSVKLRFSKPVIPGQTLQVEMWQIAADTVIFQTKVKETGTVVISNAKFVFKAPAAKL